MPRPAVWDGDPECGHDVTCPYQTHYCTYIRVPRLLGLQGVEPQRPDQLWLVTLYQWFELWFHVLLADLRAALREDVVTFEPIKLLRRGVELFRLLEQVTDIGETVAVRELGLKQPISPALPPDPRLISEQFSQIADLAPDLSRLASGRLPGLGPAIVEYEARLDQFVSHLHRLVAATLVPTDSPAPTYAEWLRLPELLSLQTGVKADWAEPGSQPAALWKPVSITPDENMFIVVHQCFELWFRVMLDHIDRAIQALEGDEIARAANLLERVVLVQHMLVTQIEIPATMQPLDFLRFRHQRRSEEGRTYVTGLSPASGTESYQFREIEISSGLRDDAVFQKYLQGTEKLPIRLLTPCQSERLQQPTLGEAFSKAVARRGIERLDDVYTPSDVPNPNADLVLVGDLLVEFDEFFRMWRVSHVTMVEKMIGGKSGTGFLGPEYLAETAGIQIQEHNRVFQERQVRPHFFQDLWDVRTRLGQNPDQHENG